MATSSLYNKGEYKDGSFKRKIRIKKSGRKMTEHELKATLRQLRGQSVRYNQEGEIAESARLALKYYRGEPFGNERTGRSSVVSRDVMDCVEAVLPELMEVFVGGDDVVKFDPETDADVEQAQQATAYCNRVFSRDNNGFILLYTALKDALVQKNGLIKVIWEDNNTKKVSRLRNIGIMALMQLMADENVELLEQRAYIKQVGEDGKPVEVDIDDEQMDAMDDEQLQSQLLYDVKLCYYYNRGRNVLYNVLPEDFFIAPRSKGLEFIPRYCGEDSKATASDLIVEFPAARAKIEATGGWVSQDWNSQKTTRYEGENNREDSFVIDQSMRDIQRTEWFLYLDYDGDGIAEYRHIVSIGENISEILENEEVDDHPYADFRVIIDPHRYHGISYADLVMDIQKIRSTIMRQLMDNMYQNNNKRFTYIRSMVDENALLSNKPYSHIAVKMRDAIQEIPTTPMNGDGMAMWQTFEAIREQRTGVYRSSRGLDIDRLHDTAEGIAKLLEKQDKRTMLAARIIAETGMARTFKMIYTNAIKYSDSTATVDIAGKKTEVDPRTWDIDMHLKVNVGLGTGNADVVMARTIEMLDMQQKVAQASPGMINPEKAYNALTDFVRARGQKDASRYFVDPNSPEYQPPQGQPSDTIQKAQMDNQTKTQIADKQISLAAKKAADEKAIADRKLDLEAADIAITGTNNNRKVSQQRMGGSIAQ